MNNGEDFLTTFNGLLNDGSDWIGNKFNSFTNYFQDQTVDGKTVPSAFSQSTLGKVANSLTKPIGSGDNSTTGLQLGLGLAGSLYGGYLQQKMGNKQLEEARRQFDFSKANTQANFMNQGTNFINQGLWQIEALNAFNPTAATERAQNFNSAVNQMNTAGQGIGLNNAFGQQQDALQKYTQLANNGPRMA